MASVWAHGPIGGAADSLDAAKAAFRAPGGGTLGHPSENVVFG
jgi:hypothetical protein